MFLFYNDKIQKFILIQKIFLPVTKELSSRREKRYLIIMHDEPQHFEYTQCVILCLDEIK